jgi:hypothetical protein
VRAILSISGTGAALVSGAALGHSLWSLWPLFLGVFVLVGAAMIIVTWAAFSSRSTPMIRLRAFVRDLRSDQRSAFDQESGSSNQVSRLSGSR